MILPISVFSSYTGCKAVYCVSVCRQNAAAWLGTDKQFDKFTGTCARALTNVQYIYRPKVVADRSCVRISPCFVKYVFRQWCT